MPGMRTVVAVTALLWSWEVPVVPAQVPEDEATKLAKVTQNPVGDLISFPFQFNFNTGGDLGDGTYFNLNFQPVIPVRISARWNAIARTIVPYASLPAGDDRENGIGDIQAQLLFTPTKPGSIIWGAGPVFSFPTATNNLVRTGSWAVGPGAVVVKMTGPWVMGGLASLFITFADSRGDPETDLFTLQPFVNYNFGKGWAATSAPLITANWDAPDGEEWTIPLGVGFSRTTQFDGRPITIGVQYYHNIDHPAGAAGDQLRFVLSLLYPSQPKRQPTPKPPPR